MIDTSDLPATIAKHRKALGLTQPELAKRAGVSRDLIASFETGRAGDISAKRLLRVLHALNLDLRISTLNRGRPTLEDVLAEEGREPE